MIRTHQIPIIHYPDDRGRSVERRYRCIEARHEGRTYNPTQDETWCLCGRVVRPGDVAVWLSTYEQAEVDRARTDAVGILARSYLDEVHGVVEVEPAAVPTECGDQYVIEMQEVSSGSC